MGKVKKANSEKSGKKKKQILPVPAAELQFGSLLSPATSAFTTDPTALAAADKALEVDAMARDLAVWQTGIVAFPVDGVVTMADLQQHALGQLPQEFINMPNLLNQLVNSIAALQNQVNGLQIQQTDQFNGLQNQILALQNQFNDMRTDISLVNNRASALGTHPLMPLRLVGPVPAVFPATLTDLRHLTTASVDQLLVYYGLPNGGHLNVKRRRLAAHIGATHME